jgi:hypothetical protein
MLGRAKHPLAHAMGLDECTPKSLRVMRVFDQLVDNPASVQIGATFLMPLEMFKPANDLPEAYDNSRARPFALDFLLGGFLATSSGSRCPAHIF